MEVALTTIPVKHRFFSQLLCLGSATIGYESLCENQLCHVSCPTYTFDTWALPSFRPTAFHLSTLNPSPQLRTSFTEYVHIFHRITDLAHAFVVDMSRVCPGVFVCVCVCARARVCALFVLVHADKNLQNQRSCACVRSRCGASTPRCPRSES